MTRPCAFLLLLAGLLLGATPPAAAFYIERASVSSGGSQANAESWLSSISADGRYVAFISYASNLVPDDTNGAPDIFVRDRQTGRTTRVSVASDGSQANGGSYWPSISADGRCVAFESTASNLVPDDTNGASDIFVHDSLTGETLRVSVSSEGVQANGGSYWPSISANGWCVAFTSSASNLVPGDTNGFKDIFVYDRETAETVRVNVAGDGSQALGTSDEPSLSADGRWVAFVSRAANLVPNDTNFRADVFVHDRQTGETTRVSVGPSPPPPPGGTSQPAQGNGDSIRPYISANGQYVAFVSYATNLVSGDTNGVTDVFVRDREAGETARVSVSSSGIQGNGATQRWPGLGVSADGRFVVFASGASNLVTGDTNNCSDIFVHDRLFRETRRVSVAASGQQANGWSECAATSIEGDIIAFLSYASNLVSSDTNQAEDVFVATNPLAYNRKPTCSITRPPECSQVGEWIIFDSHAADTDGTIASVIWQFGDGTTATGITAAHAYALDGRYTVTCTVTDDGGARNTCKTAVAVGNLPPTCAISCDRWSPVVNTAVNFKAVADDSCGGQVVSLSWTFGDGGTARGAAATHTYTSVGPFNVSCRVTDDEGAATTCSVTVNVRAVPAAGEDANWLVKLRLYNGELGGTPQDTNGYFGVRSASGLMPASIDAQDVFDAPKPPLFTLLKPFIILYWNRPDWRVSSTMFDGTALTALHWYTRDCRAPIAPGASKIWEDLRAQCTEVQSTLVLSWQMGTNDGGMMPPEDYSFTLYDEGASPNPGGGVPISMGVTGDISFPYVGPAAGDYLGEAHCFHIVVSHGTPAPLPPTCLIDFWPMTPAAGEGVSFDSQGTSPGGRIVSTRWDFGDGTQGQGRTATHTYRHPGDYLVGCLVTDDGGLTASCATLITVAIPKNVVVPVAGWQMVAAPNSGDHPVADLKVTLTDLNLTRPFCEAAEAGWVDSTLYWYDPQTRQYRTAGCEAGMDDTLRGGFAYWVRSAVKNVTLSFPVVTPAAQNLVQLPIAGWQMIGQPHCGDHTLAECRVQRLDTGEVLPFCEASRAGWVEPLLFTYEQSLRGYLTTSCDGPQVDDDDTLRQGKGYWLSTKLNDLVLVVP